MKSKRTHAVVVGASMAGMLAARVLADVFERVTILERDTLPTGPDLRSGVPQARHLHALLPRGRRIVEQYFPGITLDLLTAGAEILDIANDISWLTPQGWGARFSSEFEGVTSTRSLLDHIVLTRLRQVSNIEIIESCDATGLLGSAKRVKGVMLRRRNENLVRIDVLESDFVAVAAGRNSTVSNWLVRLGLPQPKTTYVNANVGYASQMFRRPDSVNASWRALFLQAAPPEETRAGILFPVEGNRWLVTIQGGDRDYPPLDRSGFLEFTRTLRSPELYEAIKDAEPIGLVSGYRATENRLFHYDRLAVWPESFVALGDTVCAFNPVYGQGMTTAALAAADLGNCLGRRGENLDGVARTFQRRLARINSAPWMLATSEDLRYRGVEGAKAGRATKLMHWYMNHVLRSATRSKSVRTRFLQVQGMLNGPGVIFRPSVVMEVAKQAFSSGFKVISETALMERVRNKQFIGDSL